MKSIFATVAFAAICAFAGSAGAADQFKADSDKIHADYKAAMDLCKPMKGNAKDICKVEAKGNRDVAKAELEAKKEPNARHEAKVKHEKAEAAYKLAKEKCEDMKGKEMVTCKKDARMAYSSAKSEAKTTKM